ncbi:MAG TPA: phage tail protein [Terriglobales bacterium]|nr:phage tail protein [Terriglobales bacterium]
MSNPDNNYFFLNRMGCWPDFAWEGLGLAEDGTLRLLDVPLFQGKLPNEVRTAPAPDGPSGLAADRLGNIYFSDPTGNRISRINSCDNTCSVVPCIGGKGSMPSQFVTPRGLLVPPDRDALFVADSGNHRIQVFDLQTFQLVEIWGQPSVAASSKPGSDPGQFNTPWTLASDCDGNIYVVDYGNHRVQKFNSLGDVDPSFSQNTSSSLKNPVDIAVNGSFDDMKIFVLDWSDNTPTLYVFHPDGTPVPPNNGYKIVTAGPGPNYAMGMAASNNNLYIGDNTSGRRRIRAYHINKDQIEYSGDAIGYDGPIASLMLDGKDGLWVQPGTGHPLLLSARGGCRSQGTLWNTVPIQVPDRKVVWHRLQALLQPLDVNAHFDLFVYTTSKDNDGPIISTNLPNPFADSRWRPASFTAGTDITDLYIGGKEAKYLWIGVLFLSNGTAASPVLSQLRVEFDHPTYDQYLPAIFRNRKDCDEFLPRLLSLFESFNMEVEGEINNIPALFDPKASPTKFLGWLAGCMGFELDENWDERKQRKLIAEIFLLSGRRGTPAGLRESLRLLAGVNAIIEEPIQHASWWALPGTAASCCDSCGSHSADIGTGAETSILGWTTMLAPSQPQGAVVGTSCDLDQSHLITNDDFGSPLFTDIAHRFSVGVYRGQITCAETMTRIDAVIEQEKPAHTSYEICVIEPRLRVGFQCRVGIDTVVAGTPRSLSLGTGQMLGTESVLAGDGLSRLGIETNLGRIALS